MSAPTALENYPSTAYSDKRVCLDVYHLPTGEVDFCSAWITADDAEGKYTCIPLRIRKESLSRCREDARRIAAIVGAAYCERDFTLNPPER